MASSADGRQSGWYARVSPDRLGLAGQTCASWGVAGGLVAAVVVCGHIVAGSISSSVGFLTTAVFFAFGAVIGFVHGSLLGYAGRPPAVTRAEAMRRIALGAGYAIPVLLVGWIVAMMLAVSATAYLSGRYLTLGVTLVAWVMAAALFAWAWTETRRAWTHVRRRWPDARVLAVTVVLAGIVLLPLFLTVRPEVWVLDIRPTSTTAVVMAVTAALWIVGPVAALALLGIRMWLGSPSAPRTREASDA